MDAVLKVAFSFFFPIAPKREIISTTKAISLDLLKLLNKPVLYIFCNNRSVISDLNSQPINAPTVLFCSCKLCYLTHPSCLFAGQGTTNVKENKYYKKNFLYKDTTLSTSYVYEFIDSLNNDFYRYKYRSFLFYDNGLVYEQSYSTEKLRKDTMRAFTQDIAKACCHGASIGSYVVSNDTLLFGVKQGYQNEWNYYSAKILNDRLILFQAERGKKKDTLNVHYKKNIDKIVLKTIKI